MPQASPRPALTPASRQQRILVVGEPGQGKTRLCAELLHRSILRQGLSLAWAGVQADTTMQATPYAVLKRLLTTLLARAASPVSVAEASPAHAAQVDATAQTWLELCIGVLDTPADAAVLGHLLGYNFSSHPDVLALADDARRLRDRALHHLGQAVGVLASNRAWVLWLDDLQWADAASLQALGTVMQRQPELAVLWLCSTRPEGLGRWPELEPDASDVHRLTLTGLAAHDQRRLAIHLLTGGQPDTLPPQVLLDLVMQRGEGNPYFMEETVNTLIDRGVIQAGSTPWTYEPARLAGVHLPATLTGLLQARLDALPADLRLTAQLASIVGERFWADCLDSLGSPGRAALDGLMARGLVQSQSATADATEGFVLQFHSQSLQQVAYNSVLKKVRRGLHARIARWLTGQQPQRAAHEVIAEHHELGGDTEAARDQWTLAAESALSRFDNVQVMAHSDRAMALLSVDDLDRRLPLLRMQVRVQAVLDDGYRRAECLRELVRTAEVSVRPSRPSYSQPAVSQAHLAEAYGALADYCKEKGRFDDALVAGDRAIEAAAICTPDVKATALARVAQIHVRQARYEEADRLLHQALELAEIGQDIAIQALVQNDLGNLAGDRGDLSNSLRRYRMAAHLYAQTPHKANQWSVRVNLAYNAMQLGLYSEASETFNEAIGVFDRFGDRVILATVRVNYAMTLIRLGDLENAISQADLALAGARQQNDPWIEGAALRTLGLASLLAHMDVGDIHLQRAGLVFESLDMPILSAETWAYRLLTPLHTDDASRLSDLVEGAWLRLSAPWDFTGAEEPARAAHLLVVALLRLEDARATQVGEAAIKSLLLRANTIHSAEVRTSYMQQIEEHRYLIALQAVLAP